MVQKILLQITGQCARFVFKILLQLNLFFAVQSTFQSGREAQKDQQYQRREDRAHYHAGDQDRDRTFLPHGRLRLQIEMTDL